MLLTYIDESFTKDRYLIAALIVPDDQAASLGAALKKVVENASWDYPGLSWTAELHGHAIVAGKDDWEPLAPMIRARIGVYGKALQAIADHEVAIILRSVNVKGLITRYGGAASPHSVVMTHLVERVDEYACKPSVAQNVLLIADEVDGQETYRRELVSYQQGGTWGYRQRKIRNVVDTIHFAPSKASRLVQAADLVAYIARRYHFHAETDPRAEKANEALYDRIRPRIQHSHCWHP